MLQLGFKVRLFQLRSSFGPRAIRLRPVIRASLRSAGGRRRSRCLVGIVLHPPPNLVACRSPAVGKVLQGLHYSVNSTCESLIRRVDSAETQRVHGPAGQLPLAHDQTKTLEGSPVQRQELHHARSGQGRNFPYTVRRKTQPAQRRHFANLRRQVMYGEQRLRQRDGLLPTWPRSYDGERHTRALYPGKPTAPRAVRSTVKQVTTKTPG